MQKHLADCTEEALVEMLEKAEVGKHAHIKLNPHASSKYQSACLIYIPPGQKYSDVNFLKQLLAKYHYILIVAQDPVLRQCRKKVELIHSQQPTEVR